MFPKECRHDFLYTPCSPETFTILYKTTAHQPNCFENLATPLRRFGIKPDQIPTTFNVFMNVAIAADGTALHCTAAVEADVAGYRHARDGWVRRGEAGAGTPNRANMLLIAMSGWGQEQDYRHSRAAGFDHHVKPPDIDKLRDLLTRA